MTKTLISRYRFRLGSGTIDEAFYGPYGNNVIEDFGLTVPCDADEFHKRWSASSMAGFDSQRQKFLADVSVGALNETLKDNGAETILRYQIVDKKGILRQVESHIRRVNGSEGELAEMENYSVSE